MKKNAIIYGRLTPVQKKAVEMLSQLLLDYTYEYPCCFAHGEPFDTEGYRCFYIGTRQSNPYIAERFAASLTTAEEYCIRVQSDTVVIEGFDDNGVLYGCLDFYNHYLLKLEYPGREDENYRVNCLQEPLPDFCCTAAPSVRERGIWTWGHVIYDYRGFIDNMVKLKMNTLIVWNDRVPFNAEEMVAYAHACGIRIIWGFAWLWDTDCKKISFDRLEDYSESILEQYEREYSSLGGDGIYFQTVTELNEEEVGGIVIADAVTGFVNKTAGLFFEKYPALDIRFGLHATSVKSKLQYIRNVDARIRITWENCGAFPFAYHPGTLSDFDETVGFVREIAVLRGRDDRFDAVTKGLTKLDWSAFEHMEGSACVGTSSKTLKANRVVRKSKIWRYLQAYWLSHADKALEMVRVMAEAKAGDLCITALVEDGMFEENVMYPVALYSEMLWNCNAEPGELMSAVALRDYVDFA